MRTRWSCPVLLLAVALVTSACGDDDGLPTTTSAPGDNGTTATTAVGTASTLPGETTTTASTTTTTTGPGQTTVPLAANTWVDLNPAGRPLSRERGALAYDPSTGRAILFGGWHGGVLGDTWAYDPAANTWTDLAPTGGSPSPRGFAAMARDPGSGHLILFGGYDGSAYLNDTWAYDPVANTWANLDPSGDLPPARGFAGLAWDTTTGRIILFGGSTGGYLNDTWAYDPAANTWANLNPPGELPAARSAPSLAYDPGSGRVILFGGVGEGNAPLADTWAYDPAVNAWANLNPTGSWPAARGAASMTLDPASGRMILFGGGVGGVDGGDFNDLWAYDPAANAWTQLSPAGAAPSLRWGSAAFHDPVSGAIVFFGGMGEFTYYDATWAYRPAA